MGHSGVGKSTELTRLVEEMSDKFRPLRFSAVNDLNTAGFNALDVPLVMMIKVVAETKEATNLEPSGKLLQDIQRWFAAETTTTTQLTNTQVYGGAGIGPSPDSIWGHVLGLFASIKGEIKYSADRKKEVIDYRINNLYSLLDLVNELLRECSSLLKKKTGQEWLFLGEEFDKPFIPIDRTSSLFLDYANIFRKLETHLIFNIPVSLGYSGRRAQLPFSSDRIHTIPDTPVFNQQHLPHEIGRDALQAVLARRMSLALFEDGQMMRLLVASGGNLRDLFALVNRAAENAQVDSPPRLTISGPDVDDAINNMREEYETSLGISPYDAESAQELTYETKAKRLVDIYNSDPNAKIPDPVLDFLLDSRAVLRFNGAGWFGVHPLIVDVLAGQNRLERHADGTVPGGTL